MSPILEIENLCISIGSTPILRGVDLQLETGKILGLVGESGGGKTMVCKAILDILPESAKVTAGAIRFEGISTPVASRIFDVFSAAAVIATNSSVFSICVS